jgi:hypothetical protein
MVEDDCDNDCDAKEEAEDDDGDANDGAGSSSKRRRTNARARASGASKPLGPNADTLCTQSQVFHTNHTIRAWINHSGKTQIQCT